MGHQKNTLKCFQSKCHEKSVLDNNMLMELQSMENKFNMIENNVNGIESEGMQFVWYIHSYKIPIFSYNYVICFGNENNLILKCFYLRKYNSMSDRCFLYVYIYFSLAFKNYDRVKSN